MPTAKNWISVTESSFAWEQEALEFVRAQFPNHDPYRAWSNFEFIADDGSINEVDLLVFTPHGFFLIEIKSRPGRLFGDAGTWTWDTKGKPLATTDNPVILANTKAKKLRSLLQRQKACQKNRKAIPFIEPIVFCSAQNLKFELRDNAAHRICLREKASEKAKSSRADIMGVIRRRECPGLPVSPRGTHDKPSLKIVNQAIQQAGIRPSQRSRKVNDYLLERLVDEGPGYQDWHATHTTLTSVKRRVRIYNVRTGASEDERKTIGRAARREAELLETLQHPGILRREGFTEHELGPALVFEHEPKAIRLDHFLAQRGSEMSFDARCDLVRQIAEVVRFAHQKHVVHRALSPRSILVHSTGSRNTIKIFNWQAGYRDTNNSDSSISRKVTATSHVDRLVEDNSTAYMAPEAISEKGHGEHLDIFSLGAIAYHVFSGVAPAADGLELNNKLREFKSLQVSSVMNGAGQALSELVEWSTLADLSQRIGLVSAVDDFVDLLSKVEEEAATADRDLYVSDPNIARKDDILPGDMIVLQRLGKGASSIGLLVEIDDQDYVLKAACDPDFNQRLKDEAEVLKKLRHEHIVEFCKEVTIGDYFGFLMRPVTVRVSSKDNTVKRVETLGQRLRREGQLHLDLLQRFGEDLIEAVEHLEDQGIPHRDVKPDNIAIGHVGSGSRLHLVLFDFSLSRMSSDNIFAGTTGYLDPLLSLRKPAKWDLHAERYAVAATLYEMAAGPGLPKFGDGAQADMVDYEITIDGDRFNSAVRDGLVDFFSKAFKRDIKQRFDNAESMKEAWRDCFVGIAEPGELGRSNDDEQIKQSITDATFDTLIHELGLGSRLTNALDRANILTVEDLLTVPTRKLMKQRGVGNQTRREILTTVRLLRKKLGTPEKNTLAAEETTTTEPENKVDSNEEVSVDLLIQRLLKSSSREGESSRESQRALLGLHQSIESLWPTQTDVADVVDVTRGRIGQLVGKFQLRWAKDSALNKLRTDIYGLIESAGGVLSAEELAEAILIKRGSVQDEPLRTKHAIAVARGCVEVERTMGEPRYFVRREKGRVLIATSQDLATYASKLGDEADKLAGEDPLVPPARVISRLRNIKVPIGVDSLPDSRIVRLAAAVSKTAAVSSRHELYPRQMDATRALKLSQGALYGVPFLTVDQIKARVSSRYPEAAPLPDRPMLDSLLHSAGFDFSWDADLRPGGCYVSRLRDSLTFTSASESYSRWPTSESLPPKLDASPESAEARQFEERLQRGIQEGTFLALLVGSKYYLRVAKELERQFEVEIFDFEGVFLDALREVASAANVDWELILKTDARPNEGDWDKLMLLVRRVMPLIEQRIESSEKTILIIYAGLLARYEQMGFLQKLRDSVGRKDGVPGAWILIPGDSAALMDGKAVPLISTGQQTKVPATWIRNLHRSNGRHVDSTNEVERTKS